MYELNLLKANQFDKILNHPSTKNQIWKQNTNMKCNKRKHKIHEKEQHQECETRTYKDVL